MAMVKSNLRMGGMEKVASVEVAAGLKSRSRGSPFPLKKESEGHTV